MLKASDAFRTIGEMAQELGVKPHILRYWEEQFPSLMPLKRAGGRRHYRADDADLLRDIHRLLNVEGYTIKGARKFLADVRRGGQGVATEPSENPDRFALPGAAAATAPPAARTNASMSPQVRAAITAIRARIVQALDSE